MSDKDPIKELLVKMPDGWWSVPASLVAGNRARYYADKGDDYQEEYEFAITDATELLDWAASNMNWSDVAADATKCPSVPHVVDYQEGWVNGKRKVVR